MYEKQLEHMGQTKITLETQRLALENLSINRETLEAQRVGAAAAHTRVAVRGAARWGRGRLRSLIGTSAWARSAADRKSVV